MSALTRLIREIAEKIRKSLDELFDIYKELVNDSYGK